MRSSSLLAPLLGAVLAVGCTTVPRDRGTAAVDELLSTQGTPAPRWTGEAPAPDPTPLSRERAVALAFVRSPVVQEQYAELGLSAADLLDAGKLPDLGLGYTRLRSGGGDDSTVTYDVSLAFADLLLMRSRGKLATANFDSLRDRVAARLLDLQCDVETAWYEYAAALQAARLRAQALRVARASAEYAQRLHEAGNLPPRALAQEQAAATMAEISAARAAVQVLEARAELAGLIGLPARDDWQIEAALPALPHHDDLPADLERRALESRRDLAAARREREALEAAWRTTRAWRWLGDFDVGYEREDDSQDGRMSGPTFHLTLPLLHWNRGGVLRARAELDAAGARLAERELAIRNDVSLGLDRLVTARRIAEVYRESLLPQREAVSSRTLEEVNFMLAGAFEALAARRELFEASQEYIDAVRDYWLARVELRRASGGGLPAAQPTGPLDTATRDDAHGSGDHR